MIRIAAIGIIAAVTAAWIKNIRSEYALWITMAGAMFLGLAVLVKLDAIVEELHFLQNYFSEYAFYIKILIKIVGITYLSEISSDLCRDAGANTLATQIELFGKLSILALCVPIISGLLETIDYYLGD